MLKIMITIFVAAGTILSESLVFPPYLHSYGIRKATPAHLFMFFGPITHFDDPQGLATTRLESWDDPTSKKDDDEIVVYGVNSGAHQIIYNKSMYSLGMFGKKGTGINQLFYPKGIAADSKGNVYIADSGNNRIVHLFNPKSELKWISAFNGATEKDSGLIGPARVALDEDGCLYVTDAQKKRIVVFSKKETVKKYIPGNSGSLFNDAPTALVVADGASRWSYFKNERVIFCVDSKGTRLFKIGLNGDVLKKVNLPSGYHASYGAVDFYHNYWVTDTQNHCILKYDHNLELLDIFGKYGDQDNQFIEPRGITIHKRFGQVFIAEKKGAQYYWIGTHLKKSELKCNTVEKYTLTIKSTEYSFVTLFENTEKDTLFFMKRRMVYPGQSETSFVYPGLNGNSRQIFLKIEPTYSSYSFQSWVYPISISNK